MILSHTYFRTYNLILYWILSLKCIFGYKILLRLKNTTFLTFFNHSHYHFQWKIVTKFSQSFCNMMRKKSRDFQKTNLFFFPMQNSKFYFVHDIPWLRLLLFFKTITNIFFTVIHSKRQYTLIENAIFSIVIKHFLIFNY